MATVEVDGETYTVSAAEKDEWQTLVEQHFDPMAALRIATGNVQDIDPPIAPDGEQ